MATTENTKTTKVFIFKLFFFVCFVNFVVL